MDQRSLDSSMTAGANEMKLVVKHFSELSADELFELYKLRVSVFVVEQKCPYQEVDDADERAYHVWLEEDGAIRAYLRVLEPGAAFPVPSLLVFTSFRSKCTLITKPFGMLPRFLSNCKRNFQIFSHLCFVTVFPQFPPCFSRSVRQFLFTSVPSGHIMALGALRHRRSIK